MCDLKSSKSLQKYGNGSNWRNCCIIGYKCPKYGNERFGATVILMKNLVSYIFPPVTTVVVKSFMGFSYHVVHDDISACIVDFIFFDRTTKKRVRLISKVNIAFLCNTFLERNTLGLRHQNFNFYNEEEDISLFCSELNWWLFRYMTAKCIFFYSV